MNLFEIVLFDFMLITFPLVLYLFYIAYNQNVNKAARRSFLNVALLTSTYFVVKFGQSSIDYELLMIINVPLIIAYYKGEKISILLLSLFMAGYYWFHEFNIFIIIFEYLTYYIIYLILKRKSNIRFIVNTLMILKAFFMSFSLWQVNYYKNEEITFVLLKILIISLVLFLIVQFVLLLLDKGDEILNYHSSMKKLEKEKQIRTSLFQITHEIKNPIAVCKGYLDMLDVKNQKQTEKYIPIIKEEIGRTLLILQDFLSISKIKIDKEPMDVNMLVEDVIQSFKPILKEKKIETDIDLLDDEIYIDGDYNRLTQVLINIIKNSIESLDKDEKKILIKTDVYDDKFSIKIVDNGIGMNKDELSNISKPFFTTKKDGTGLGVLLSKQILDAHNAAINYESVENLGTTVNISIPIGIKKMS